MKFLKENQNIPKSFVFEKPHILINPQENQETTQEKEVNNKS